MLLIAFEGGSGSGKTTQIEYLVDTLQAIDFVVMTNREPGGTALGETIRDILKSQPHGSLGAATEAFLYLAARSYLVNQVILPALEQGLVDVLILDRYTDSTLAYQGFGSGLDLTFLRQANFVATEGLLPDLTIYLDVPVGEGLNRQARAGTKHFAQIEYRERVRQGYLALAQAGGDSWLVINTQEHTPAEVSKLILKRIFELLPAKT